MTEASTQAAAGTAAGAPLKYANPRDLPSFPSSGLRPDGAAAGAAASLGWSNQKPIEPWQPEKSSASATAAALARGSSMSKAPESESEPGAAGRKAAMLAVGSAATALKKPATPARADGNQESWGNSAATLAFSASRASLNQAKAPSRGGNLGADTSAGSNPAATQAFNADRTQSLRRAEAQTVPESSIEERSLAAAKGAMSANRPRATSLSSAESPKAAAARQQTSTTNALSGATTAHRASMPPSSAGVGVGAAGATPVTTMTRNMFTSHPLFKTDIAEQQNEDKLHASAVAMAKQMYAHQQRAATQSPDSPNKATSSGDGRFMNLQDAAYKQAQERLAKLETEHQKNRQYQEYYNGSEAQPNKNRFSFGSRLRRKSSSDTRFDDQEESRKIRQQMSMFNQKVSQIDEGARQKDRDNVLAAAQRNVKARLQGMDEKVYRETGRSNPNATQDWESKAQAIAQDRHAMRTSDKGKVDIGGGKFMDPEEVDAIAQSRIQPVLDDINDKAEVERERRLALKMEMEAEKEEERRRREREKEIQQLNKQAKAEEKEKLKAIREQEKIDERHRKDAEKARKDEEKQKLKAEKAEQEEAKAAEKAAATTNNHDDDAAVVAPVVPTVVTDDDGDVFTDAPTTAANEDGDKSPTSPQSRTSPTSPTSPSSKGKVKGWLKNRFSRGKSISDSDAPKRRSLFGGGGSSSRDVEPAAADSTTSLDNQNNSLRDVALAGKSKRDSKGVSPVSTPGQELCDPLGEREPEPMKLTTPRPISDSAARTSVSPSRDSRFREEIS